MIFIQVRPRKMLLILPSPGPAGNCSDSLLNFNWVKHLKVIVIIWLMYLYNCESLSDIIRMCIYGNSKENKLLLQSKIMASVDKNIPDYEVDLPSLGIDSHCLDCVTCL